MLQQQEIQEVLYCYQESMKCNIINDQSKTKMTHLVDHHSIPGIQMFTVMKWTLISKLPYNIYTEDLDFCNCLLQIFRIIFPGRHKLLC